MNKRGINMYTADRETGTFKTHKGGTIMKLFTLDEIFEMAIGAKFLSPELKAKDEAMFQTEDAMRRTQGLHDATYLDEDDILDFSKMMEMKYDINGNIIV